jgi:hypothetical protein
MTTIFTSRRDGRAGHSTVQFRFAIAITATSNHSRVNIAAARGDQTRHVRKKYCCIPTFKVRFGLDGVARAAEQAYSTPPSDLVNPPKTGHLANVLDRLIDDHANNPQILLNFGCW